MSRPSARVMVVCDECQDELELELPDIERLGLKMRNLDYDLRMAGWTRVDKEDYCLECTRSRTNPKRLKEEREE